MDNNIAVGLETCRICCEKKGLLFSLYRKRGNGFSPFDKLVSYTGAKIRVNDGGSASICSQCLSELDVTVQFLDKCVLSNRMLRVLQHNHNTAEDENFSHPVISEDMAPVVTSPIDDDVEEPDASEGKRAEMVSLDASVNEKPWSVGSVLEPCCAECGSRRRCRHWAPPTEFTCKHCCKVFNRKSNFILHLKRHSGEREFPCPACGFHCLTHSLAQRHCAPRARHPCPQPGCDKSFTTTTNLRTHVRVHSGERPYRCSECDKGFTSKNTLNDHKRIHTGEKPYMCPVCGKSFTTNKLSAHMTVHAPRPPLRCPAPGCARACPSRAALARHARTHAPPTRAHPCPLCPARYNHSQSRNKHLRKQHGQQPRSPTNTHSHRHACTKDEP